MASTISINRKASQVAPRLSLQSLPPEIRNMIYRLVAKNPERTILVRRLMKTHMISQQQTDLPLLLKNSTTLDPLA